jgi:hypothetical protein
MLFHAGMHRSGTHPTGFVAAIEFDREQHVRGLRAAIGDELLVVRMLEVRIVEIHVAESMTGRGQLDQPPAVLPFGQAITPALAMMRSSGLPSASRASAQRRSGARSRAKPPACRSN